MKDGVTLDTTNTISVVGSSPRLEDLLHAMESARAATYHAIALPSVIFEGLREREIPTAHKILADMRASERSLLGMRVHVSRLLDDLKLPMRRHRKRKWMSEAYHRRIQKKWTKRFGVGPAAFVINERFMRDGIAGNAVSVLP